MPTVPTLARSRRKLVFCRMVAFGWTTIGAPTHLISNLKARSWYGACLSLECCTPPKLVTKPLRWIVSLAKHGPAPHPSTWSFPAFQYARSWKSVSNKNSAGSMSTLAGSFSFKTIFVLSFPSNFITFRSASMKPATCKDAFSNLVISWLYTDYMVYRYIGTKRI